MQRYDKYLTYPNIPCIIFAAMGFGFGLTVQGVTETILHGLTPAWTDACQSPIPSRTVIFLWHKVTKKNRNMQIFLHGDYCPFQGACRARECFVTDYIACGRNTEKGGFLPPLSSIWTMMLPLRYVLNLNEVSAWLAFGKYPVGILYAICIHKLLHCISDSECLFAVIVICLNFPRFLRIWL